MARRIVDILCGAASALLATMVITVSATEEIPPERAERHRLAVALGDHAVLIDRPVPLIAPPPPRPLEPVVLTARGPGGARA